MRIGNVLFLSFIATTLAIFVDSASADDVRDKAQTILDDYMKSQLVVSRPVINATDLAGCMILHKDNEPDQYVNVLPGSVKSTLKPNPVASKPFRHFYKKEEAASAGVLKFLGISSTTSNFIDISITEQWTLDGPSLLGNPEIKNNLLEVGKYFADSGYQVFYNQSVRYAVLTTNEYTDDKKSIKAGYAFVDGNGTTYYQTSDYAQKEIISIAPLNITVQLKQWKPTQVATATVSKQFDSLIQSKSIKVAAMQDSPITLHPVPSDVSTSISAYLKTKNDLLAGWPYGASGSGSHRLAIGHCTAENPICRFRLNVE